VIGLLTRFPQYTLSTLLAEDERLLRYVNIVDMGQEVTGDGQ
jgi:hypothetical protein